jgi:hypothetical protein
MPSHDCGNFDILGVVLITAELKNTDPETLEMQKRDIHDINRRVW